MTPEEWAHWARIAREALGKDAYEFQRNYWRPPDGTVFSAEWNVNDLKDEDRGEFIPGRAGLDIVKISFVHPYEVSPRPDLIAEMWRGAQHVRQPLNVGRMEEFVSELKDDGFQENLIHSDCLHYLWRKRSEPAQSTQRTPV